MPLELGFLEALRGGATGVREAIDFRTAEAIRQADINRALQEERDREERQAERRRNEVLDERGYAEELRRSEAEALFGTLRPKQQEVWRRRLGPNAPPEALIAAFNRAGQNQEKKKEQDEDAAAVFANLEAMEAKGRIPPGTVAGYRAQYGSANRKERPSILKAFSSEAAARAGEKTAEEEAFDRKLLTDRETRLGQGDPGGRFGTISNPTFGDVSRVEERIQEEIESIDELLGNIASGLSPERRKELEDRRRQISNPEFARAEQARIRQRQLELAGPGTFFGNDPHDGDGLSEHESKVFSLLKTAVTRGGPSGQVDLPQARAILEQYYGPARAVTLWPLFFNLIPAGYFERFQGQ